MTTDTTPAPATTTGVDRRSVVRTAAWSLPVIAVSAQAPAFAASCNQLYPGTLDPSTQFTKISDSSATAVVPLASGGGSVTITFSAAVTSGYSVVPANFGINSPIGGTGLPGIHLGYSNQDTVNGPAQRYILTMTFSRTVSNLDFLVTDIDLTGNHDEQLAVVQPTTFTRSFPAGSNLVGAGTSASPIHNGVAGGVNPNTGTEGNVRLRFDPVTSVRLWLWDGNGGAGGSHNWITRMSFSALADGCP